MQADAIRGYLDGVEFGLGAGSQLWEHSDNTGIGGTNGVTLLESGSAGGFAGLIDELRIYNRALNAAEVAELANEVLIDPTTCAQRCSGRIRALPPVC